MAVYYKFKSAKNYDSINIDGHFISVANLKERIFESKHLGRGTDFDLMISNAQTDEEYADEAMLIPKNTSVMVRRVPGRPRKNIVTQPDEPKVVEDQVEDVPQPKISISAADSSAMRFPEESEWDEFGNDLYAIPEMLPVQSSNPVVNIPPPNKVDEESKIKALVDTPALDWNRQVQETYGPGRGYGRGMGGRMMGGRGFGRGGMERGMERGMMERGLERKNPPAGYICHRCKVPGHFIQHCPTNGDPNYDIRRVKPPTGIPKSMLMATPDGSYALPSGAVAVLKPNEAAFEKEIEGMPSTRSVTDLPPELRCPLCKDVMKDAVLTSKCCFSSFCDKCIRDHIISKSMCVCGATNILADDLLPNKTLRETINRIMESTTSSTENVGSLLQAQDMESAHPGQPKAQSPTLSATTATKEVHTIPCIELAPNIKEGGSENRVDVAAVDVQSLEKKADKNVELSVATPESTSAKEPMSQGSAPVPEEDVQEKLLLNDQGKRKKKKKIRVPGNAGDMQWRGYQDLGAESYAGMPFLPSAYNNPYFAGMPWGMDGFAAPFPGAMPMMGYAPGPYDVPFGGVLPQQDPFGGQGYMMPVPPHRDLAELSMGGMSTNLGPPIMSREEFEAKKADMRRRREMDRRERESSSRDNREREMTRNVGNSAEISSLKSKPPRLVSRASKSTERPAGRGKSPEQQRPSGLARDTTAAHHRHVSPPRAATKRKSAHPDETGSAADTAKGSTADRKHKGSVFSRISFPGSGSDGSGGGSKKRKSGSEVANGMKEDREHGHRVSSSKSNGYRDDWRPPATTTDKGGSGIGSRRGEPHDREYSSEEEEEEEEYHFKRRPSSRHHEAAVEWEEEGGGGGEVDEGRSSHKGSRERERARDHHDHHDRAVKRR